MKYCEPYQSCALFGAMRYFSNLKNCVSLINGPTGCAFYANSAIIRLNGYFNARHRVNIPNIYCTDFNEKDAIMGCEEKVRQAAEELLCEFHPEMLFLFNCCVAEIIGSDIDTIAEELSEQYETMVIPVHTAGFKGDHKYGMRLAGDVLMKYFFCSKSCVQKGKVNLLGEFDYFNRSTVELSSFLQQIGITDVMHVPGRCSLAQLREATNAELNVITCQNASRYLAERMKQAFDIPYLGNGSDLYSIEHTAALYRQLCRFFGKDPGIVEQMRERALQELQQYLPALRGKSAFVVASTRRALGYSAILRELGVEVKLIFSESDQTYTPKQTFLQYSKNVLLNEYPNDLVQRIEREKPDYIFSTLPELIAPYRYLPRPEVDFSGMEGSVRMAAYLASLPQQENAAISIDN